MSTFRNRFEKLEELLEQRTERTQAGYQFELFLFDLFRHDKIEIRPPVRREVDQIDGAFQLDGSWYLIEAKWRVGRADVPMLDHFHQSVQRSLQGTVGFLFSYAGFTADAVAVATRLYPKSIVLADGEDLRAVVSEEVRLTDLLRAKVEAATVGGNVFLRGRDILPNHSLLPMTIAAMGRPVTNRLAIGPVLIYDREHMPENRGLSESILVAAFDDSDVDPATGKFETWPFEQLLDSAKGAISNIGGGLDHFTTRVREGLSRRSESSRPALIFGLFDQLHRRHEPGTVQLGDHAITEGTMLAVDGRRGAIYIPAPKDRDLLQSSRRILETEASRWTFFDRR